MTIWRFYIKPSKLSSNREYELYAITNKKKLAKAFMNTRRMDLFVIKKSEEDKDAWIEFANENRGAVLDFYKLQTSVIEDDNYVLKNTKVPITFFEYQNVDSDQIESEAMTPEFWDQMPPYIIFNEKILDALRNLEYVESQRFFLGFYGNPINFNRLISYINDNSDKQHDEDDFQVLDEDDDYACPDIVIDELSQFINIYRYLLI